MCRCGCYDEGPDWEDPDAGHPEVIVVDATDQDENAQLSQPLIVKDADDAPPGQSEGGGAVAAPDPNAAAVTNQ